MKKLNLTFLSFLAAMALIVVSCTPEPEPTPDPIGPSVTLLSGVDIVDFADTVEIGETFAVSMNAATGDTALSTITIMENGTVMSDFSRIMLDGFPMGSNPSPIADPNTNGFTWKIEIVASDEVDATNTYTFNVTDANGITSADVSVDITTVDSGTPVEEMTMILLFNQGGKDSTGAVDLHTGMGTGTQPTDTIADIRDQGIDLNEPGPTNWIQKIAPINGSDLRVPDASFVYGDIEKKEEIAAAFDLGTSITQSDVVQEGDQFLVLSGGTYFALIVTKIEITETNNEDFYEFSVKK